MVLKKSRNGINSGNTHRATNTKFHQKKNQEAIIRRTTKFNSYTRKQYHEYSDICCSTCDILEDVNLHQDVPYSLNKKKRWELSKILENSIKYPEVFETSCAAVIINELNVGKINNASVTSVLAASQNYENGGFLTQLTKERSLMNKKSLLHEFTFTLKNDIDSLITITTPIEPDNNLYHHHKFIGYAKTATIKKIARCHRKNNNRREFQDSLKSYHEHSSRVCDFDCPFTHKSFIRSQPLVSCQNKTSSRARGLKLKNGPDSDKKGEQTDIVNDDKNFCSGTNNKAKISKEVLNKETKNLTESSVRASELNTVSVWVPHSDVTPINLRQIYGFDYVECPCCPRRFIINITERIEKHMQTSGVWKGKDCEEFDVHSCIVFCHRQNTTENSVNKTHANFDVSLNIGTSVKDFRILTLSDNFQGSLADIIQKTVFYINMISGAELCKIDKRSSLTTKEQPFKILNMFLKVNIRYDPVSTTSLYNNTFGERPRQSMLSNSADVFLSTKTFDAMFCEICFQSGNDVRFLTLLSCGHMFCEWCWFQYIRFRICLPYIKIICPNFACSAEIPDNILLTFVSVPNLINFTRRRTELNLYASSQIKWCPNRICSRVLSVTNQKEACSIACTCGITLCYNCMTTAHWPLSCQYTTVYRERLKQCKVDPTKNENTESDIKFCPNCKIPIERIGKGLLVNCICGQQFCWGCHTLYPNHPISSRCFSNGKTCTDGKTKHRAMKTLKSRKTVQVRTQYYKMALSHRAISRNKQALLRLQNLVEKIVRQCRNISFKRCSSFYNKLVRVDEVETKLSRNLVVKERISGALWELFTLYKDFHHISEYSLMFLEELMVEKSSKATIHVPTHVNQLSLYAENIASLLQSANELSDHRLLIDSLLLLEQQCQKEIEQFVQVVKRLKQ